MKLLSSFIAAPTILVSVFAAPAAYAEDYDIVFEADQVTYILGRNPILKLQSGNDDYIQFKMVGSPTITSGTTYTIGVNDMSVQATNINDLSYAWESGSFTYEGDDWAINTNAPAAYNIQGTGVIKDKSNNEQKTIKFSASTVVPITVTLSDGGYATFVNPNNIVVPTGVTAYCLIQRNDETYSIEVAYSEGTVIPAWCPVILKGESNATLSLSTSADRSYSVTNLLSGATDNMTAEQMLQYNSGDNYFYAFTLDAASTPDSEGFYWMTENGGPFDIAKGKVYLALPKSAGARPSILMSELTTGINIINAEAKKTITYNLQGQRVKAANGLVIRDGKMMFAK